MTISLFCIHKSKCTKKNQESKDKRDRFYAKYINKMEGSTKKQNCQDNKKEMKLEKNLKDRNWQFYADRTCRESTYPAG